MTPALPGGKSREFVYVTTFFLSHSSYFDHDTGPGHPERPDRIRVITEALEHERFAKLIRAGAPGLDRAAILRVHPAHYVDAIEAATPARGKVHLDPDTVMSAQSFAAIGHCVGAATAAVDEVMRGGAKNAFAALRPPGHHAGIASPTPPSSMSRRIKCRCSPAPALATSAEFLVSGIAATIGSIIKESHSSRRASGLFRK